MNTQRITISIPANIHALLVQHANSGNVSRYISESIHNRLIEDMTRKNLKLDEVKEFLKLRKETKKLPTKRILYGIHKGRNTVGI